MTNFQGAGPSRLSREQVLVLGPALLGGLAALALAVFGVAPVWQGLEAEQLRWQSLQDDRQRLPLLRRQLLTLEQRRQRAEAHNRQIVALIAGSGELTTLLAQLSSEAAAAGVVLDRYEPVTTPPAADADPKATPKPAKPPTDPLLAPGLTKTTLLLTARGGGAQLVQFLRRLERLSPLVVQSDLAVKAGSPAELRLNLSLYGERTEP
jgi:type IV pilus assembly protein PilO